MVQSLIAFAGLHGIDVSNNQGAIQWNVVATSGGKSFAWVKASEGVGYKDPRFEINMNDATTNSVKAGAYHFARPVGNPSNTGTAEANSFLDAGNASSYMRTGYLRPALDIEDYDDNAHNIHEHPLAVLGAAGLAQWIQDWCSTVMTRTGVTPIVYMTKTYAQALGAYSSLAQYPLWIATDSGDESYNPVNLGPWGNNWAFQQYGGFNYTACGNGVPCVPGIMTRVDLDYFPGTASALDDYLIGGDAVGDPTITLVSPTSTTLNQGATFTITYTIDAPSSRAVILGASLFPAGQTAGRIDDSTNDVKVSVPTGQSIQQRQFTIPSSTNPGTYDLRVALWNDVNNNGIIDGGDQEIARHVSANAVSVTSGSGCSYSLYPVEFTLNNSGGAASSLMVSTSSTCRWTASSHAPWISLTGLITASGSATVTFSVAANTSTSARQGTITVEDQTFTITQSGGSPAVTVSNLLVPPTVRRGQTTTIYADVNSSTTQSVLFGGTLVRSGGGDTFTDRSNDTLATVFAGVTQYHRPFAVSLSAPVGTYDVTFSVWNDTNSNGFVDPGIDTLLGTFTSYGALTVQPALGSIQTTLEPQAAVDAGAQWRVDEANWLPSGFNLQVAEGNHTLSYKPITGWTTPPDQIVAVQANQTTQRTGTYTLEPPLPPATYTPLSPTRVWDTRSGPGPVGQSGPGQTRNIQVTGVGGIPATGVTAVALNVTAINPTAQTFVTAWPTGEAQPLASNLNIPAGDARPNLVIVKVGAGGQVSIFNNTGNVDFVADVAGWYGGTTNERYTAISPARLWDTRSGPGPVGQIEAGGSRNVSVTGIAGVPATGVTAVVLNVTAASPSARTFITAWPAGEARPLASNLNVPAGDVRPNLVIVKVGASGQVSFFNNAGDIDLIADVAGYFSSTGSSLNSVSPSRIWDTRSGPGPQGRIGAAGSRNVTVTGIGGVPATGVTAVVLNVTGVRPSAARTFITAFPAGEAKPLASNLNVPANDVRANLVIVKVGGNGQVTFYNNSGDTDVVADVAGWYGLPGQ